MIAKRGGPYPPLKNVEGPYSHIPSTKNIFIKATRQTQAMRIKVSKRYNLIGPPND